MINFKTYIEFIEFIEKNHFTVSKNGIYDLNDLRLLYINNNPITNYEFDNKSDYYVIEYCRGGQTGGSCWDTEIIYLESVSPNYFDFDDFCQLLYHGDESFVGEKYDDMIQNFVLDIHKDDEKDYYGNYEDMGYLVLDLKYYYEHNLSLKIKRLLKIEKLGLNN